MRIYGKNPVIEAIKAGSAEKVYVLDQESLIINLAKQNHVPIRLVHKSFFDNYPKAQGTACDVPEFNYASLSDIDLSKAFLIACSCIVDPRTLAQLLGALNAPGAVELLFQRKNRAV